MDNSGIAGYWEQQWEWTQKNTNSDYYWRAVIQIHLGNTNEALDWLEESYKRREGRGDLGAPLVRLLFDEHWDSLHDQPRFIDLLKKVGFTNVMPPRKK